MRDAEAAWKNRRAVRRLPPVSCRGGPGGMFAQLLRDSFRRNSSVMHHSPARPTSA